MSGKMARYYNHHKNLTGSFWEGRYKSTLIQNGAHFGRCLFYIDLNMVRAGVVRHPREWRWSGHHELIGIRKRYCVLNIENLIKKVSGFDYPHFLKWYTATLDGILENEVRREALWTESKCVGDEDFVTGIAGKKERKNISETGDGTFYF
jgi:putative transposase